MKEARFISRNKDKWKNMENGQQLDAEHLAANFIELSDDLAYARTFYPGSEVERYLNQLIAGYQTDINSRPVRKNKPIWYFWKQELPLLLASEYKTLLFAFFFFGPWLGRFLFQNEEVGVFLRILSFLSPFLYLETTLGSILNGLGKTSLVFFQNLAGDVIRILAILFLVPVFGIRGYLYGILASELTIMTMALLFLHRESANGFAVH